MKKPHPVLFILFILLLANSSFSQRRLGGRVTEIIDGRTVKVETVGGKLTAVLLYIEIPAPDQPLFETVREHLGKLVLGKHVDFQVHGIMSAKTLGQLYLNGVDIGEQLVRDGAAWHLPADQSGQDIHGSTLYEGHQMQAKREKRGVWSIENLKPSWQFRVEKEEDRRQKILLEQSAAKTALMTPPVRNQSIKPARSRMWADTNPALSNIGALLNGYNAETKTGHLETPLMPISGFEDKGITVFGYSFSYLYKEDDKKNRKGIFMVLIGAASAEGRFLNSNDLVVISDEQKIVIGKAKRSHRQEGLTVVETLTYEVKRSTMEQIVNGRDVVLKVGNYLIRPSPGLQMVLHNMLQVTE